MNTKNDKGESYTIIHSGQKATHHRSVALIMNRESANTLMEWEPINERLIKAGFNSKYCKLTIIQCYAPTNDSEDETKEEWYDQLQAAMSKVPQHDVLLIMGDMNSKTGSDNRDRERAMGREGCGIINDNGEKFVKAPNDTTYKRWSCHSGFKLLCKLCRTSPPPAMGSRFTVFGHAGHADPLDGWRCCSQKRVMSRPIQVRQL